LWSKRPFYLRRLQNPSTIDADRAPTTFIPTWHDTGLMFAPEKITEILARKPFTLSVEVFPPRNGRPPDIILDKLESLSKMPIDFVSVTKGAMGSMRGGTVPIGYMISERYEMNALVHFRCRDMNRREVENLLVDHMYFGTRNILAVLGDPLPGEPENTPDPSTHNRYACELVRQISEMNRGKYLPLPDRPEAFRDGMQTDFCLGVACYPEADDQEKELFIMREKAKAGADFAITQMVFSAEAYARYVDRLKDTGTHLPVIPGVRPVTCMEHVQAAETVFGAIVPDDLKEKLKGVTEQMARDICIDFSVGLCTSLKEAGAPGVHMFTLNDVEMARDILDRLGEL
jgi:methylenetetrahydrofolate reductase (NADPH)